MRLIDADALMEIYADRMSAVAERYSIDSSECGILSGAMKLLDIQPTIELEPHWIPCSERLPEEDGRYLVCGAKGGIYHANYRRRWWTQVGCGGKPVPTVVAWMPLPKAYEVTE